MKSVCIRNGDVVLTSNGDMTVLKGRDKLIQDLTFWLLEPIGTDPANPYFGSKLPDLVGTGINSSSKTVVETEVRRVLSNFVAYQTRSIQDLSLRGGSVAKIYSPAEVVREIISVDVVTIRDAAVVKIHLRTANAADVIFTQQID